MEHGYLLAADLGKRVQLAAVGVRFMIPGEQTDQRFALLEHQLPPRALGAPLHTHHNEDEYSYVLQGTIGVQIGDQVLTALPGSLVFKPRGVPHAFWNAGDEPAVLLELISPAGFERYFDEAADLFKTGELVPQRAAALFARYGLEMDLASVPRLIKEHGLAGEPLGPGADPHVHEALDRTKEMFRKVNDPVDSTRIIREMRDSR